MDEASLLIMRHSPKMASKQIDSHKVANNLAQMGKVEVSPNFGKPPLDIVSNDANQSKCGCVEYRLFIDSECNPKLENVFHNFMKNCHT